MALPASMLAANLKMSGMLGTMIRQELDVAARGCMRRAGVERMRRASAAKGSHNVRRASAMH